MSRYMLEALVWFLAICVLIVVVLVVRQWRTASALSKRNVILIGNLRARDEEIRHLASVRLPALVESSHQSSVSVPGPLYEQLIGSEYGNSLELVMEQFTQSVNTVRASAGQSARAALVAAMRALQGLASEQQLSISAMQDRHDHPQVLQDLLEIDHTNAQFGRRAQAIAVLCGAWPGRQRAASTLENVVRGATSRIRDYRRVQVHTQIDTAAVGRVVEPVVLAVAELLDNAARHSQPNTSVEVNIHAMHNGAVIVIDDGGVGMHEQETRQAALLLSGEKAVDVTKLGDPPQFGFPVIGVLAKRYGFRASVDSHSPYGGVRAVVFLPNALLTNADVRDSPAVPIVPAVPVVPTMSPSPSASDTSETRSVADGLPQRRRRPVAEPQPSAKEPAPSAVWDRPAQEAAAIMGAFQRGTRSGRASIQSDNEGNLEA
ncbi:ATP-binding protein [Streptosporangium subroseum]|uniref:ATP-binding protein n=1 Tax=Streptosporangium subroseum TaxID=106412 RepID=UPI0034275278